jgi:hypothetical protein
MKHKRKAADYRNKCRKFPTKRQYISLEHANNVLLYQLKKGGSPTGILRPYFCQVCQRWHITSKPLWEDKGPKPRMI